MHILTLLSGPRRDSNLSERFIGHLNVNPRDGLGFAEHYFAEANGEGNSGEGVDV
jgi:hypothetical protein